MSSYILADYQFDLPYVVCCVAFRDIIGRQLHSIMKTHEGKPDKVLEELRQVIMTTRPHLKNCIIGGVQISYPSNFFKIMVMHPSLPPVPWSGTSKEYLLEPCATCGKDMEVGSKIWMRKDSKLCCSEECVDPIPDVPFVP